MPQIEAAWKGLSPSEQEQTIAHTAEIQKRDWKELSIDEKKAVMFVNFGAYGPREAILPPGHGLKTLTGTVVGVVVAAVLFYFVRIGGQVAISSLLLV